MHVSKSHGVGFGRDVISLHRYLFIWSPQHKITYKRHNAGRLEIMINDAIIPVRFGIALIIQFGK